MSEMPLEGSEHLGCRVGKDFDAGGDAPTTTRAFGRITKWVPDTDDDEALWHVVYDDGVEEDFNLAELLAARALPLPDTAIYALEHVDDAFATSAAGHVVGKLVISIANFTR